MQLSLIKKNLKDLLEDPKYAGMLDETHFKAVFCATQELDQYERMLQDGQAEVQVLR